MRRTFLVLAVFGTLTVSTAFADPHDVQGLWLTQDQDSIISIRDCGDGTPCGFVHSPVGEPDPDFTHDVHNPDPELRGQPLLGMKMMHGFKKRGNGWRRGKIYDPTTGKTYGSGMSVDRDGNLKVKGCLGPLCQTQIWTPVLQQASASEGQSH